MRTRTKRWIGIIIALILLLGGFYLYYFYPQLIPGMAGTSPEIEEDVHILLIGRDDEGSVEEGEIDSDSIMLATIKAESNKLLFRAIPSDTKYEDDPIKKISPEDLPDTVEELTGIKAEYYFSLSYDGFKKVINELGGIKIELEDDLQIPDLGLDLKKGENILSGKEALNYVRWYDYEKNEIDRLNRHQQVIESILDKVLARETLTDIPQLYSTIIESYKSVETNMDKDLVDDLIELAREKEEIELEYEIIDEEAEND
ncbi:MAG: LCP family protein [Halanaerobiales bacterium]